MPPSPRCVLDEVPVETQDVLGLFDLVEHRPPVDVVHRMEPVLQRGARRRSSRRHRAAPRTGRRSRPRCHDELPVGRHHIGGDQIVQREPVATRQIADPPPRVSPAIPVVEMIPPVVARPNACVAALKSPHVAPPSARAVFVAGSDPHPRIMREVTTTPSSFVPNPGALCPPPLIERSSSVYRVRR